MKLISKYNRVNIITLIVALIASGICFYFVIRFLLRDQLDAGLQIEKAEVIDFIAKKSTLPEPSVYNDQEITYTTTDGPVKERFSNVYMRVSDEDENELIRQLEFSVLFKGKYYLFKIRESQEETESLIAVVVMSTLGIIVLMLVLLFLLNRLFFRQLWQPFNTALNQIKKYNLSDKVLFYPQKTDVDEFNELNKSVEIMTKTIEQDYTSLKSFTENTSHEIQTPLAIIRSKLEILMQDDGLRENQLADLVNISEALDRLSRLNRSLILLTRIDNRQFGEVELVDLTGLIRKEILHYEELLDANEIKVTEKFISKNVIVSMNLTLAETLVSNLVTNSIKHNIRGGEIEIILDNDKLVFQNTGKDPQIDPRELFERFRSGPDKKNSLGLGLSIVKKITDLYNFRIRYDYSGGIHCIRIVFR